MVVAGGEHPPASKGSTASQQPSQTRGCHCLRPGDLFIVPDDLTIIHHTQSLPGREEDAVADEPHTAVTDNHIDPTRMLTSGRLPGRHPVHGCAGKIGLVLAVARCRDISSRRVRPCVGHEPGVPPDHFGACPRISAVVLSAEDRTSDISNVFDTPSVISLSLTR